MSDSVQPNSVKPTRSKLGGAVKGVGELTETRIKHVVGEIEKIGGLASLLSETLVWTFRGIFRRGTKFRAAAIAEQMVRVGVDSIGIVVIVQAFIGCILALQMAPTLEQYGQLERVADIIAIAIVRELGPMLTAIVLSGFAGASIAAEIGAMVESEEIKALRAHALDPVHFLVVPRFLATITMIIGLTVIANIVGVLGGMLTCWGVLGIAPFTYLDATQRILQMSDLVTGLVKAGVFGALITMIACHSGLNVSGGAVGVGRCTTATVVKSILAIICVDAAFAAIFYTFEV